MPLPDPVTGGKVVDLTGPSRCVCRGRSTYLDGLGAVSDGVCGLLSRSVGRTLAPQTFPSFFTKARKGEVS